MFRSLNNTVRTFTSTIISKAFCLIQTKWLILISPFSSHFCIIYWQSLNLKFRDDSKHPLIVSHKFAYSDSLEKRDFFFFFFKPFSSTPVIVSMVWKHPSLIHTERVTKVPQIISRGKAKYRIVFLGRGLLYIHQPRKILSSSRCTI